MKLAIIGLLFSLGVALGADDVIVAKRANSDFELSADPDAPQWKDIKGVLAVNDAYGRPVPGYRTVIKARWTRKNLYVLFVCPYKELFPKPGAATTDHETPNLWEWDVAEMFLGGDFNHINRYREFQVSPRGEFVDLDIDSSDFKGAQGMKWDSGFKVKARIDRDKKVWYGEMRIPLASIDKRPVVTGNEYRVNFYRLQGPKPDRVQIAWRPTNHRSYHIPESFGRLILKD